jgi:hypothetical protein
LFPSNFLLFLFFILIRTTAQKLEINVLLGGF